jgi:hypothetical protein
MPDLAQVKQENQTIDLPLKRTESSIPREGTAKWDYPSPQQFYNALVRKGWETPEEHVVTMVEIHNFLNEEAWEEVKKWEKRRTKCDQSPLRFIFISDVFLATVTFNSPALKVGQERCPPKRSYTCSLAGSYHPALSEYMLPIV